MRIYIGYDEREKAAYDALVSSLDRVAVSSHRVTPLKYENLRDFGFLTRPVDRRDGRYDLISNAQCATEFSNSRFFVPHLAQTGWALFMDADMLFFRDPEEMLHLADPKYAVMVVKHPSLPDEGMKMDNCPQLPYPRKNWSSVVLWNVDHPANKRLTIDDVNRRTGRDLHGFYWLHDEEIGELPDCWNWLVDVRPKPDNVGIAHFTLGGPFVPGWVFGKSEYDQLWLDHGNQV